MNERRTLIGYCLLLVAITIVGFCCFLWPTYKQIAAFDSRIQALLECVSHADEDARMLASAHTEWNRLSRVMAHDLKTVPTRGDLPALRSAIGEFVSSLNLGDHDFKRGRDSGPTETWSGSSLALNVDTAGPFESVYELLKRIESLPRLVRIRQVILDRDKDFKPGQVLASISVDAYYHSESTQDGSGAVQSAAAPVRGGVK